MFKLPQTTQSQETSVLPEMPCAVDETVQEDAQDDAGTAIEGQLP